MPRRVRVRRKEPSLVSAKDRNKLVYLVDSIASNIKTVEELSSDSKEKLKDLEALMKRLSLLTQKTPQGIAEYVTPQGKASSTIDVSAFKELVAEEDFMEAISVTMKNAKKLLSERELEGIVDTVKAQPKEPVLVVRPL